jgi:hypothetical protein
METQKVVITDIDIPFGKIIVIILKWTLAAIPAILLFYGILFIILMLSGGVIASFFSYFLR